ncbi:phage tail protein [Lachnospiraceae bacterium 46-61]
MQKYYSVVTDIGEELLAKAAQQSEKLNIVSLAAGDGNGAYYRPTSDMTALKKECWRGDIKSYEIDSISKNVIKVSGVIPSDVGRFVLRELALFDDNDNMIVVSNAPDLLKAVLAEGALTEAVVYMRVAFSNTDVVNIQVNSSVIYATMQELDAHKNDENAHKELFSQKVDKTNFTGENIGTMLEEVGWQSGSDMTEVLDTKANKDLSNVEQSDFNNKFMIKGNIFIGNTGLPLVTTGDSNIAVGNRTLTAITTGSNNVAICNSALYHAKTANFNIAIGQFALTQNQDGNGNIAIGQQALNTLKTGNNNTAIGFSALSGSTDRYNATGIGENTDVTGDNQVQIGSSGVTVYTQTAIQTRSDYRDKLDIQNTILGLEFIKKLIPRQFRMNSREAYFEIGQKRDFTATNDGSKAGKRFHQGFVAQEVKTVLDEMGIDFAGYQDHKINGGEDVLSLGYTEFIAPIVKAIQEQQKIIEMLEQKINKLQQKINAEV